MLTTFQLVASAVFVAVAVAAYRNEIFSLLKKLLPAKYSAAVPDPSPAVLYVRDLVAIAELRDKLFAENCAEGVEACTNLLRVIVEKTQPPKVEG